jgi:catechol 2,3-dioxygenase-like lactoylglutathione lyase family enzyme
VPSLHHTHLMSADLDAAVGFYTEHFGGEVVADVEFAGARNVFMRVGRGALHFYDQPPNHRGPVNHLGMLVEDLDECVRQLTAAGLSPRPISDTGAGRYAMVEGPDGVLLELFEPPPRLPPELEDYFAV